MVLLGAVSTLVIAVLMAATLGAVGPEADDALRRHPAGRARHGGTAERNPAPVIGPDDDPEFINSLEWLIRGGEPDEEP